MPDQSLQWQIRSIDPPPEWFVQAVKPYIAEGTGQYAAQLLWQRGIRSAEPLAGFLNPNDYPPTSAFEFGQEMHAAVKRLKQAWESGETVAIWGDFDADGVTATAVLWDGLGQFFTQQKTLFYYIPNRLTESHGLSQHGIDTLHAKGSRLIVTCDTGSTNLTELEYAQSLGIDVIVTDHHTLPAERPPVVSIINPRSLSIDHPLATLSGVAVAYKLVEALYTTLPEVPQMPLERLLDLVAIGLIADLVELKGDCRYLAQRGIKQLQKQADQATATRPGITKLLELCNRSGDRPTDISFGLGPRINAVSRIQGDAHFCVELLTSQDAHLCSHLAEATELANSRRKALQADVTRQAIARLSRLDLSTTSVIVLSDEQWPPGVLGLVAGQIAQEYARPTILLSTEGTPTQSSHSEIHPSPLTPHPLARGSARSINNIDLYQLVRDQEHLLHRFGGHPYAAGLSLPVENIPVFTDAINQRLWQLSETTTVPSLAIDLVVTVAELGKRLFHELKLLEPCGMGNPAPKLLIQNCWFDKGWHKRIQDWKGRQIQYIKTEFELWDDSAKSGFAGVWWGHYKDELPHGRCDVVVELDSNNYKKRYEVRLIAVRSRDDSSSLPSRWTETDWILDWRGLDPSVQPKLDASVLQVKQCPSSWSELQAWFRRSAQTQRPLAIAYPPPSQTPAQDVWQQLVGIAKYLSRTGKLATRQQLLEKLQVSDRTLQLGFKTLVQLGFSIHAVENAFQIQWQSAAADSDVRFTDAMQTFFVAVREEQFRRQYFYQVPLSTIRAITPLGSSEAPVTQTILGEATHPTTQETKVGSIQNG